MNYIEKGQNVFRMLYSLLNRNSKMANYKSVIRPIITYGSPIWSSRATTHKNGLQIFQKKCLKTIYNLPSRFHTDELHELSDMELIN